MWPVLTFPSCQRTVQARDSLPVFTFRQLLTSEKEEPPEQNVDQGFEEHLPVQSLVGILSYKHLWYTRFVLDMKNDREANFPSKRSWTREGDRRVH